MLIPIFAALCAVVVLVVFLLLPGESNAEQRAPFWGANIAHRGLHNQDKSIPENSIAAFTAAIDAGYGIELDVRLSKDGDVVVFHDDDLNRACGSPLLVDECTTEQLKEFSLFGTSQRIPLLSEVLELTSGEVPLLIELKKGPQNERLCRNTWRILRQYDGDVCIESFDPRIVRWYKKNVPGLLRGQLAALPKDLNSGFAGTLVGLGLTNVLSRPHFIAYQKGYLPLTIRFARLFAMRVLWTARPTDPIELYQAENDAIIFEWYQPDLYYLELPDEPANNPAEEEYRF